MPRPPEINDEFKIQFMTNQLLAGCVPPYYLILEFAEEPALDLLLVFLPGNWFDIVQGMFGARKGRGRNPARHGRKRRRLPGIPDVDERIGNRLSSEEFAEAAHKLPGFRVAFRVLNIVEAHAILTAVLEGVTRTAFGGLTGFFKVRPDACVDFDRFNRTAGCCPILGGIGPLYQPIALPNMEFAHGFATGPYAATSYGGHWAMSMTITALNDTDAGAFEGGLALRNNTTGETVTSQIKNIPPGSAEEFSASITAGPGEFVGWYWLNGAGHGLMLGGNALGFGEVGWLQWAGL